MRREKKKHHSPVLKMLQFVDHDSAADCIEILPDVVIISLDIRWILKPRFQYSNTECFTHIWALTLNFPCTFLVISCPVLPQTLTFQLRSARYSNLATKWSLLKCLLCLLEIGTLQQTPGRFLSCAPSNPGSRMQLHSLFSGFSSLLLPQCHIAPLVHLHWHAPVLNTDA